MAGLNSKLSVTGDCMKLTKRRKIVRNQGDKLRTDSNCSRKYALAFPPVSPWPVAQTRLPMRNRPKRTSVLSPAQRGLELVLTRGAMLQEKLWGYQEKHSKNPAHIAFPQTLRSEVFSQWNSEEEDWALNSARHLTKCCCLRFLGKRFSGINCKPIWYDVVKFCIRSVMNIELDFMIVSTGTICRIWSADQSSSTLWQVRPVSGNSWSHLCQKNRCHKSYEAVQQCSFRR